VTEIEKEEKLPHRVLQVTTNFILSHIVEITDQLKSGFEGRTNERAMKEDENDSNSVKYGML